MLTPEDIEQKTFSTALRGYDLNEVDDFLDEVMATVRDLTEQLEQARSRRPAARQEPNVDESAVGRAIIAAQATADRIVEDARAEAERIGADARSEADTWIKERDVMKEDAEREMADLSRRVDAVRRELAVLATGVADSLDRMDEAIDDAVTPAEEALAEEVVEVAEVTEEVVVEETTVLDADLSWDSEKSENGEESADTEDDDGMEDMEDDAPETSDSPDSPEMSDSPDSPDGFGFDESEDEDDL